MGAVRKVLVIVIGMVLALPVQGESVQHQVLALAAAGDDYEAVALYEREFSGKEDVPQDVLRAVAGSYWRLRQFDVARDLYRRIMQQQPSLAGLSGVVAVPQADAASGTNALSAVPEKGAPEAAEIREAEAAANPMPSEQVTTASEERQNRSSAFQAELDALRQTYVELEADRERQRQSVESRIMELMVRTQESVEEMASLQNALAQARAERTAAEEAVVAVKAGQQEEQERLTARITDLEQALVTARADSAARETQAAGRITALEADLAVAATAAKEAETQAATLEATLTAVRDELATARERAAAQEDTLAQRIAEGQAREMALADRLVAAQEAAAAADEAARAGIAEWEERVADLTHQLDTERIAARARREEHLDAEARLQATLSGQRAEVVRLQDALTAAQEAAEAAAGQQAALEKTLVSERAAYQQAQQEAQAQQAALATRLAEEEERVNRLAGELKQLQEQAQVIEAQAHARFAELEQERDAHADALEQAHAAQQQQQQAAREREAQWQAERTQLLAAQAALQDELQQERQAFAETEAQLRGRVAELENDLAVQQEQSAAALAAAEAQRREWEEALAARDAQIAELLEAMSQSSIQLALQEIALMEEDFARQEGERMAERQALEQRIAALESASREGDSEREALVSSLQAEREVRAQLEAQAVERGAELARAQAMLDEATAALNRQYDALRKQLEVSGVAVRVTAEDPEQEGLVPLIDRIEAATESATLEVRELRSSFDAERAALAGALATVQSERDALAGQLDQVVAQSAQAQSEQKEAYEARLKKVTAQQAAERAQLQAQVNRMERALAGAQALAAGLQASMEAQRQEQLHVLRVTRDSTAALNRRIAALESGVPAGATTEEIPTGPSSTGGGAKSSSEGTDSLLVAIQAALADGNREQAIAVYTNRDPATPVSQAVLLHIGNAYREQSRYQEAYALFSELLARDPGNLYAEQKVVMTLFDMGEYDKALDRLAGYEETPAADGHQEK